MCYEVNTQNYLIRTQFSKCIWEADEQGGCSPSTVYIDQSFCFDSSVPVYLIAVTSSIIPQTNTESPLLSVSDQSELPRIHLFAGIFLILIKMHQRWFTEYTLLVDSAAICLESTTYCEVQQRCQPETALILASVIIV